MESKDRLARAKTNADAAECDVFVLIAKLLDSVLLTRLQLIESYAYYSDSCAIEHLNERFGIPNIVTTLVVPLFLQLTSHS